jgi:LuxR family maltose regulon positive regulatory protein
VARRSIAAAAGVLPFPLSESKLHPPPPRGGIIERASLVARLSGRPPRRVLAIVAPAGYGKTTLLAQWAERTPRVGWVSLDDRDNDPVVLLVDLAVALDRIEPIDPTVFRELASPGAGIVDVARLVSAIGSMPEPVTLALDHAEVLTDRACRDVIAELAMCLPAGSQLAIASRSSVPVPVARLRADDAIVEVGAHDLAVDRREAGALLASAGVELTDPVVDELFAQTEGWPAGLYLAALAINAGSPHPNAGFRLTGDDRFIDDYLRTELLSRLSAADVNFLTRTSVLDRFCGPLCDAIVGSDGSSRVLERLETNNLFVVPLDRRREWYRYHHLFRELLHAELMRRERRLVPELCRRAAEWHETNELPEVAITYAQRGGDATRVARIVLEIANPVWSSGRVGTVLQWMEWFSANRLVEQYPAVAVHGSLIHALVGRAGDADRWAAAAERSAPSGVLPDGNTMEGSLAYMRALLCRDGLDEVRRDARLALEGLGPTSPYRPAMLHAEGLCHLLRGDLDEADRLFVRASDEATSAGVVPFVPVVLAERGIVAIERGDWAEAEALADEALALMGDGQFDDYWTSALVYAWGAHTAAHRGDAERACDLAARAARLRPLLTYAIPVVAAQALLELVSAYLTVGDPGGARAALGQVDDILRQRPRLGTLTEQAEGARSRLDALDAQPHGRLRSPGFGPSSLTTAELRVLQLLPTHLSVAEIADHLYVSRNTVKSQTIAIYRKLGTSSRSRAVDIAVGAGLLQPTTLAVRRSRP